MNVVDAPIGTIASGDAIVRVIRISVNPSDSDVAILSRAERERAGRYRVDLDRSAFVTTRAALRRWLGTELGLSPEVVPIVTDAAGRPRVDVPTDLDFNVTHARAAAAIAVSRGCRVGVDIEGQRSDRDLRSLVPHVMSEPERAMLSGLDGADFVRKFYVCWTRKEAIIKAIGVGLAYPLAEIDTVSFPLDGVVVVPDATSAGRSRTWTVRTAELLDGFTLSVALAGAGGTIELQST